MRIGVLALQGAFREHREAVSLLGAETVDVRTPEQLEGLDGLVIPGGESTAISKLMAVSGMHQAVGRAHAGGMAVFGTCAGAILLSRAIEGAVAGQVPLGLLDVIIRRNAYGRQVASFETNVPFKGIEGEGVRAVFIRAPRFDEVGEQVEVLARLDGEPVAVRQGRILAVAFHPELTPDTRVHRYFMEQVVGS